MPASTSCMIASAVKLLEIDPVREWGVRSDLRVATQGQDTARSGRLQSAVGHDGVGQAGDAGGRHLALDQSSIDPAGSPTASREPAPRARMAISPRTEHQLLLAGHTGPVRRISSTCSLAPDWRSAPSRQRGSSAPPGRVGVSPERAGSVSASSQCGTAANLTIS